MELIYTFETWDIEKANKSIFLAGPTPRSDDVISWRPDAIEILESFKFNGMVFIPEYREGSSDKYDDMYLDQIGWEHVALDNCEIILMWVPRELKDMPAFTTNVEYGLYVKSQRLFYGRPASAPKNEYLDCCYRKFAKRRPVNNLSELIKECISCLK